MLPELATAAIEPEPSIGTLQGTATFSGRSTSLFSASYAQYHDEGHDLRHGAAEAQLDAPPAGPLHHSCGGRNVSVS